MTKAYPRIGLALGSGGARGWAHVGVLNSLRRRKIPLCCIAGASAGAIFGAAHAAGKLDFVNYLAHTISRRRLLNLFVEVGLPRAGLLTGRRIQPLLDELASDSTFETLKLPFAAVATDLQSGREVVLASGPVGQAVRASISIPGIFTPVIHDGLTLVDGGLANPLPVSVARALGAEFVIAVDVNLNPGSPPETAPDYTREWLNNEYLTAMRRQLDKLIGRLPPLQHATQNAALRRWFQSRSGNASIFEIMAQSLRIFENQVTRFRLTIEPPDLLVQPPVGYIQTLEPGRIAEAIAAGETAMEQALRHTDCALLTNLAGKHKL